MQAVRADALGVLNLLLSAKASIRTNHADAPCVDILDECIARLEDKHQVSPSDLSNSLVWTEFGLPVLLRLLSYAQAELEETLQDEASADLLNKCIAHLLQVQHHTPFQMGSAPH
ncbi:MAG TPA: hypothetical protein VHN11_14400 [Xanthobacteraceae bacterium]|nr:hypothetical protein [Xanthobacteraceae bacterium]